jgi:hypothetical protein
MKRFVLILLGVVAVVALMTAPAPAADFKFGGFFKQTFYYDNNLRDGTDDSNDNTRAFYMRMRLYFTAVASENLMAVSKVELDDVWGQGRIGRVSVDGGSNARSDEVTTPNQGSANSGFEIKNAYLRFNLPNTPLTFQAGALPILLGYGLAFNDDTNALVAIGKFDPVKVTLAYSRLNDNALTSLNLDTGSPFINERLRGPIGATTPATLQVGRDDWDLWAADLRFAPTKELALGLAGTYVYFEPNNVTITEGGVTTPGQEVKTNLFNLVLDVDYKTDLFSVYFTGGKNFGDIKIANDKLDFDGYILSLGGTVNVQPVVVGLDLYYASGQKLDSSSNNIDDYVTPGRDGRYTNMIDEVVFPGMFDDECPTCMSDVGSANFTNIRGTGITATNAQETPVNIWAIGAHVNFKPLEQTLIQVGGAYMGFAEKVYKNIASDPADTSKDDTLGISLYARLTQGIVDGLQLKAAFGYLFADDGYAPVSSDDDAYKLGVGLFWSW